MNPAHAACTLSDEAIVSIWEDGRGQTPVERALTVLRHVLPSEKGQEPERWSVGERDARLLDIRSATFGPHLSGVSTCPECGEALDVAFDVDDIRSSHGPSGEQLELEDGEYRVLFRLPTSVDMLAIEGIRDHHLARQVLAGRCVIAAERGDSPLSAETLPDDLIFRMGEAMANRDPQSDIQLDMTCPACSSLWRTQLDIAAYLCCELDDRARRLLNDVHTLAMAYGWREADIVAMSPGRRQVYLDLVMG